MYKKPPIRVSDSMAIAAALTTATLVGASAIAAYRVSAVSIGVNRNATGFTDVRLILGSTILLASGLSRGTAPYFAFAFPYPGYVEGANVALQWSTEGTAAAGSAFIYCYYYSDPYTP